MIWTNIKNKARMLFHSSHFSGFSPFAWLLLPILRLGMKVSRLERSFSDTFFLLFTLAAGSAVFVFDSLVGTAAAFFTLVLSSFLTDFLDKTFAFLSAGFPMAEWWKRENVVTTLLSQTEKSDFVAVKYRAAVIGKCEQMIVHYQNFRNWFIKGHHNK